MAGDWIKVSVDVRRKPEVKAMARDLGIEPDLVVGKLVRLWSWADGVTENGRIPHCTASDVDEELMCAGMANSLIKIGWLRESENSITLPNFERHNGKSAKRRALDARRLSEKRRMKSDKKTTKRRPEKRREEKSNTPAKREPNPVWDCVAEQFFPSGVTEGDRTRVGKIVRDLTAKKATPQAIVTRKAEAERSWSRACTPEALVKHWDQLGTKPATTPPPSAVVGTFDEEWGVGK